MRADLQQYYGIDLDRAARLGEHLPTHVADCAAMLPQGSRVLLAINKDTAWSLTDTLLAMNLNFWRELLWVLGRRKGAEPERIGPSWMRKKQSVRKVDAMAMTVDELLEILSKPRRGANSG